MIPSGMSPFLNNATNDNMRKWWAIRAVPGTRSTFKEVLKDNNCLTGEAYLVKNLGLSINDSYWMCPVDSDLDWEEINLYKQSRYYNEKMPYHNATSYDPNASLSGQMEKYWDMSQKKPVLVKTASTFYGQQAINETFATYLHKKLDTGVNYVDYMIRRRSSDNSLQCLCDSFTSTNIEFVPAFEIIESRKRKNDRSLYDTFIDICEENGIQRENVQKFMDYQTLTDFIISNTDEHLLNFGVLRNSDTMRLISPAPIFDSGNSMFYSDTRTVPYDRSELLQRKITAFQDKEEKMLSHVKDVNVADLSKLPSAEEVRDFYRLNGIEDRKADFISENYLTKVEMVRDMQNGMRISLYDEKRK